MQPIYLAIAVTIGTLHQIMSIKTSPHPSDCLALTDTCISESDICNTEHAFSSGACDFKDEACQIKGSKACNVSVQSILEMFPSLQGCMCAWEERLCAFLQLLNTQCHQTPAPQQNKASPPMDWQSSDLIEYVYDNTGSCLKRVTVCLGDHICNKHLVPLVNACSPEQCDSARCQHESRLFYHGMPSNVAEMLVMCDCEPWDQACVHFKTILHSGKCGGEAWTCLDALNHCLGNWKCRELLKTYQAKCWHDDHPQCDDVDECVSQMDPALIHGADVECRHAFVATMGSELQYPCTCMGLYNNDEQRCKRLHDVFHNRSHFMMLWRQNTPSELSEMNESDEGHRWITNQLLYVFSYVILVGVVLFVTIIVLHKVGMLNGRDNTKFQAPEKASKHPSIHLHPLIRSRVTEVAVPLENPRPPFPWPH